MGAYDVIPKKVSYLSMEVPGANCPGFRKASSTSSVGNDIRGTNPQKASFRTSSRVHIFGGARRQIELQCQPEFPSSRTSDGTWGELL